MKLLALLSHESLTLMLKSPAIIRGIGLRRTLSISSVNSSRNSLKVQHADFYCGRYRMIKRRDTVDVMNSADKNSNDLGSKPMSVRRTLNPVLYNKAIPPPRFCVARGTCLKL